LKLPIKYASIGLAAFVLLIFVAFFRIDEPLSSTPSPTPSVSESTTSPSEETSETESSSNQESGEALTALASIAIKGRAPQTGYSREVFADDWDFFEGCDVRNRILARDLIEFEYRTDSLCIIERGVLEDPFTGQVIEFQRGVITSLDVQIDHVVSLSDAWQKGAQQLSSYQRFSFYNDPLNLLAVWGPANSQKSDSDAASWLPSNKGFRCSFVARQIAVKVKYQLWVTQAEHDSMTRVLASCPMESLPN
jgi:hypothetical protein